VIIGLSATPCRADGRPLQGHFEELVAAAVYSELIAGGFIDAPLVYSTPMPADLSRVHTAGGDYNLDELEDAVNRGALVGNIGAEWQKRAEGRRTVVFCVSVKHSLAVRDMFRELGVTAEHLDGTTEELERAAILSRLACGYTQVVCNVGVLTEGWDCPPVKCGVIARPTKSLALWMQMAGRFLRPWGGITPLLLDHGGNVDRLGMPHADREWSLTGKPKKAKGDAPEKVCKECFAYIPASSRECPHCAAEQPKPAPPPPPEPVVVDLALRTLDGDDAQLAFFRKEHKKARERGWKFGAVLHRFRERFGQEPPATFIKALKSDWRGDGEWKARIAARAATREEREAS
jgi:superfamily II DNA or RNA helicase